METFFTSDTHFYHKNILKYEDRPFDSVEEMTEFMIERWNNQVTDKDVVYHLGDVCVSNYHNTLNVLKRLNGNVILIKGNHDSSNYFNKIYDLGLLKEYHQVGTQIKYKKQIMNLTHYPMEIGHRPNLWSIHGHIHSQYSSYVNQINVGVDSPSFKSGREFGQLITIEELYDKMMAYKDLMLEDYL